MLLLAAILLTCKAVTPKQQSLPKETGSETIWTSEALAGDYIDAQCYLRLSKEGAIRFAYHSDMFPNPDPIHGTYKINGDEIDVQIDSPSWITRLLPTDGRYYPCRWGKDLYLVKSSQMIGFCTAGALGSRNGPDFMSSWVLYNTRLAAQPETTEQFEAAKAPAVPKKFEKYLSRANTPRLKVIAIKNGLVTLDRGSDDFLLAGTIIVAPKGDPDFSDHLMLLVLRSTPTTSTCRLLDDTRDKLPKVSDIFIPFPLP